MKNKLMTKKDIRLMSNHWRFDTIKRFHNQNLAEHSFYVALIANNICNELNYDNRMVLEYALIHDLAEIHLGDITHDIKHGTPEINEVFENLEKEVIEEYYPQYKKYSFSPAEYDLIKLIVKIADLIDALKFCLIERDEYKNKDPEINFIIKHKKITLNQKWKELKANIKIKKHWKDFII